MTGYDLKTSCFDQCIAHLWPADQAQIYRTLDKLVEQGWITSASQVHGDPSAKVYSVTKAQEKINSVASMPSALADSTRTAACSVIFRGGYRNEAIIDLLEQRLAALKKNFVQVLAIRVHR